MSAAGALALGACGGDGDGDGDGDNARVQPVRDHEGGDTGDAARTRPARARARSRAPRRAASSSVVSVTPLETMDPSEIYYTHTYAIGSAVCVTGR